VTVVLFLLNPLVGFTHISIVYLIPVMICATRWGTVPAVIAAIAGFGCADFFFYPPLYTFWVDDPRQLLDLVLFLIVAVVTGYLANMMRHQAEIAPSAGARPTSMRRSRTKAKTSKRSRPRAHAAG